VWSTTDLTEGRGRDYPYAICKSKSTAMRLAIGRYVQGSDCPITTVSCLDVDGLLYFPVDKMDITLPTKEDKANDAAEQQKLLLEQKREAVKQKAQRLGLTEEELSLLSNSV